MKNNLITLTLSLIVLSGCSASRISFDILAPSSVYVPSDIKNIAVVNRSLPSDSDLNQLEGILTGEGKDQDILASQHVIDGMKQSLQNSDRYQFEITGELLKGSGIGTILPSPLSWDIIDELCRKYGADAIVALEAYDSDFVISGAPAAGVNRLGIATGTVTKVECGFRMYNPANRTIVDEFIFSHSEGSDNSSMPILQTINAVARKKEAVRVASVGAGMIYGRRIIPAWIMASRDYFRKSKKSPDLEEGARMMQLNNWDNAIDALTRAVETAGTKDRGRAAHNLAVVYEILGDLDQASEWTTVAWGRYREKKSREYGAILNQRIREQQLLNEQMDR